ncbi:MAG: hypothetical protein KKE77_15180 [Alphaproteobacteria bacterium]|nr:hypothetical protein [Alphaproteobacteria bacterium]MBU2342572.1 hypothetical protein [Alphaproteobacteria bacterium]
MDFDDLLHRYFGSSAIAEIRPGALEAGIERMLVDFGLEQDRGKRFALWSLLHLLGAAPNLEASFESEADREAARNLMDMLAATEKFDG